MNKVYDIVNKQILDQLEQGNIPWKMPWKTDFPMNLVSKNDYSGFNWWILLMTQEEKGYKSNIWATIKQISDAGGKLKKDEHYTPIIFWTIANKKNEEAKNKEDKEFSYRILRFYRIYNLDQTTGIEVKKVKRESKDNLTANGIINKYKKQVTITEKGDRAFYSPEKDYIQIPLRKSFISDNHFYATNFHEMVHSTGHEARLNRFKAKDNYNHTFGSEDYSKEELIAEMGSSYLSAKVKILPSVIKNKSAYIQSWLTALKNDKTLLVSAGGKAQKAVDFILHD